MLETEHDLQKTEKERESDGRTRTKIELELELIKTHMTQKPILRVEVGACRFMAAEATDEDDEETHASYHHTRPSGHEG